MRTCSGLGLYLLVAVFSISCDEIRHPIILVPGDGGSRIEARINRTDSVHFWCFDHSDWYDIWLNIVQMLPPAVDCWEQNIRLRYNFLTRSTENAYGVETRIPGFGETESVEYLDSNKRSVGFYFVDLVNRFVKGGYIRGHSIRGAPFDFRRAAQEHAEFFSKLKMLIEETFKINGNVPVVLMTHSMGSIMTLHFLNNRTQEWKDQHVRSFVSLAGVWGGTMDAVKVFTVGDNLGSSLVSEKHLLWQRTCSSLAWLMPSREFWGEEETLVVTPERNYTRRELPDFYKSISHDEGYVMEAMVNDTKDLLAGLPPPNVEVHCIHSSKVPTVEQLYYRQGYFPNYDPDYVNGDGDGTVNIRSLEGCLKWGGQQSQAIFHTKFEGLDHLGMIRDENVIDHVDTLVKNMNQALHKPFEDVNIEIV